MIMVWVRNISLVILTTTQAVKMELIIIILGVEVVWMAQIVSVIEVRTTNAAQPCLPVSTI